MNANFYIKTGDRLPSIQATLANELADPYNLTNCTVKFTMRLKNTPTPAFKSDAVVVDATNGIVRYDWNAGDTALAGLYQAEWEVTYLNGKQATFPNSSYLLVKVTGTLVPD